MCKSLYEQKFLSSMDREWGAWLLNYSNSMFSFVWHHQTAFQSLVYHFEFLCGFSLWMGHTLHFICMLCNFFLNWTFEPNNVVTLEVRFSPFSRVFLFFFFDCCRLSLCHGSAWGINVRLSQVFSEPASFAVHAQWLSKLPFLNCICGYF